MKIDRTAEIKGTLFTWIMGKVKRSRLRGFAILSQSVSLLSKGNFPQNYRTVYLISGGNQPNFFISCIQNRFYYRLKLSPQPQLPFEFGFLNVNSDDSSVSYYVKEKICQSLQHPRKNKSSSWCTDICSNEGQSEALRLQDVAMLEAVNCKRVQAYLEVHDCPCYVENCFWIDKYCNIVCCHDFVLFRLQVLCFGVIHSVWITIASS